MTTFKLAKAPMAASAIAQFKQLDTVTHDISVKLMELGIGNRVDAMPFAALAAKDVHKASFKPSQRGYIIDEDGSKWAFDRTTPAGNAAYMTMYRWLDALYAVAKAGSTHDDSKTKFDAERVAKSLAAKYSKAQLQKIIALL